MRQNKQPRRPITFAEFESECESKIGGRLWHNVFNETYQEHITLTVAEMRYIANVLRTRQGDNECVVFDPITSDETKEGK